MPPLFDTQFDNLAAETHGNLPARALTAIVTVPLASTIVDWRQAVVWFAGVVLVEIWCWFATRRQHLRQPVGFWGRVSFLANLTAVVGSWMGLVVIYWYSGTATGALCGMITLMCIIGFAQLFASRSPLGFAICGVAPAIATFGAIAWGTPHPDVQTWSLVGALSLGLAFAVAGARQTYLAARRHVETEARLTTSESQVKVLADNVTDIIGRRALDGTWRYVSPSVQGILGYSPEEFAARDPATFVHPEDLPAMQAGVARLLAGDGAQSFEHRAQRNDGVFVWLETNCSLVRDPSTGVPKELVSVTRDITARKALEAGLIQARVHAEAAAAAKSDFLANMTHELRTPLNAIVGFSGVLRASDHLSTKDSSHVALIHDASATLLAVVNGVLDFSKLETGGFELDPRPFDVLDLAQSTVLMLQDQATERGLYLRLEAARDIPPLLGDAPRLQQVLLNLLGNALKFTREGGVELAVWIEDAGAGCHRLCVAVRDTGIGVPVDKQDAIFERFSQADASVSRNFGGTGLGLAISQRIIGLMGGGISVASRLGEGSTFSFAVDLPTASPESFGSEQHAGNIDQPIRLLLVEDNEVNRQLVETLLEPFSIDIDVAVNGLDAIEAVRGGRYDVVLMDVQMPVMDGLTATRAIRGLEDPSARDVPIVAMTANVLPEQIARCRDAGMDDHIGKPLSPTRLIEALNVWTSEAEVHTRRRAAAQ